MNVQKYPLSCYVNRIALKDHFALSRYGDGEWTAMLGYVGGKNCDGHQYFPELGDALRWAVTRYYGDPDFLCAVSPIARRTIGGKADAWLTMNGLEGMVFHHTGVFVDASINGELSPFVQALRRSRMIYVGPPQLRPFIVEQFAPAHYVTVPQVDCFLDRRRILGEIRGHLSASIQVIAMSASMLANVLAADLWGLHRGMYTVLDLGSLFDPYATGKATRSYMTRMDMARLLGVNFARTG